MAELTNPLDELIDAVMLDPGSLALLVAFEPIANLHVQHCLHTAILSLFLGRQLGFETHALKSLGVAALLHDIGRLLLPSDFTSLYKLREGDAEIIRLHCRDGAALLAGVPNLPLPIIRPALEHHMGHDGLGYPDLPVSHTPHMYSKIIALADFVSWGTVSDEYYHRPVPIHRLIRSVLRRAGSQFDPLLVKLFVPFFGLYPPGTRLRLTALGEAVSLEPNLRHLLRPLVVVKNPNGMEDCLWLAELIDPPKGPFRASVDKITGQEKDFEPYFDFLPNLSEKKHN
jgi:HD-GYP domain-containing protein (c-di-GMP phosphodiesterase class II)